MFKIPLFCTQGKVLTELTQELLRYLLTDVLIIRYSLLDAQDFPFHAFPLLLQPSVGTINTLYQAVQQMKVFNYG